MDGAVCKDDNGNLFFGSQNGACYFNPEHIIENVQIAPVKLQILKVTITPIQVAKERLSQSPITR